MPRTRANLACGLCLALALVCVRTFAAEHELSATPNNGPLVVAGIFHGVLEAPANGVLADLHQLIATETGLPVAFEVQPIRRARHAFYAGRADSMFAVFPGVERPTPVVYSLPFAKMRRYIFTREGQPAAHSLPDLKDLRLGLVKGFIYNHLDMELLEAQGTQIHWSPNQNSNLKMLNAGRVDAIIATAYECALLTQNDISPPIYDADSPVTHYEFVYAFHDTASGRALEQQFSKAIQSLSALGKLKAINDLFDKKMDGVLAH